MVDPEKKDFLYDFNGIFLVDKPKGMTSFDVLRSIKRVFFLKK